jgi:hypothetical protein
VTSPRPRDGTDLIASRLGLGTWAIGGWMWGRDSVGPEFMAPPDASALTQVA